MSEKQEKKVVGRNVAIVLGIICIILAVGFAYYITVMNSRITDRDNTILQLNNQITTLHSQLDDLNATVSLTKSTSWATDLTLDSSTTGWGRNNHESYAGYLIVVITSSSSFKTSVELSYSLPNGISYDRTVYLNSTQNSVWFPILPALVHFYVINLSPFASVEVSATYYY